jgi:hypothetical protein
MVEVVEKPLYVWPNKSEIAVRIATSAPHKTTPATGAACGVNRSASSTAFYDRVV